jgi:hypothetical protein
LAPTFEIARREALIKRFQQFKDPLKLVQGYAIEDGESARQQAMALVEKKDFEGENTIEISHPESKT